MIEILVISLLILMTALYVAAEFAVVSVKKPRIQHMAEEGNKDAIRLLPIVNDVNKLDEYISVSQVGITLSSLILGAYSQDAIGVKLYPVIEKYFNLDRLSAESTSSLIILVLLTIVTMVIGELIPKSLALQFPVKIALYTLKPMIISIKVFKWFLFVLNGSGNAFLKLFNIEHTGHRHVYSTEEISMIIEESRSGGLLQSEESRMLHQALKLEMRTARQLMIPRLNILAINIDLPLTEIKSIVSNSPYTRLPVYQGTIDNIIGILHTKDLIKLYSENKNSISLKDLLSPVTLIPETIKAEKIMVTFKNIQVQQAIVIDEFGIIVGLITLEDVIAEIMGEIGDEFKRETPFYQILDDNKIRISGLTLSDEASELTGINWEGESDTIGGLISEELGRLPASGEKVMIQDIEVIIERVENRIITSLVLPYQKKEIKK